MTLTKGNIELIDQKNVSKPSKAGIRIISEMSTPRILWFVTARHSAGLKTLAIVGLVSYIAWDKVVRLFV